MIQNGKVIFMSEKRITEFIVVVVTVISLPLLFFHVPVFVIDLLFLCIVIYMGILAILYFLKQKKAIEWGIIFFMIPLHFILIRMILLNEIENFGVTLSFIKTNIFNENIADSIYMFFVFLACNLFLARYLIKRNSRILSHLFKGRLSFLQMILDEEITCDNLTKEEAKVERKNIERKISYIEDLAFRGKAVGIFIVVSGLLFVIYLVYTIFCEYFFDHCSIIKSSLLFSCISGFTIQLIFLVFVIITISYSRYLIMEFYRSNKSLL